MAKQVVKIKLPFQRETKGSILYQLSGEDGRQKPVQNIYIKKEALPKPYPPEVTVSIEID